MGERLTDSERGEDRGEGGGAELCPGSATAGCEQPEDHRKVEGERQTPKKREEGSQGQAAIMSSAATSWRGGRRQASARLAQQSSGGRSPRLGPGLGKKPRSHNVGYITGNPFRQTQGGSETCESKPLRQSDLCTLQLSTPTFKRRRSLSTTQEFTTFSYETAAFPTHGAVGESWSHHLPLPQT